MRQRQSDKGVTWEELFFDLAFVFAVTQITAELFAHHDLLGVAQALILFISMYWAWVGVTIYANQRDIGNVRDRVVIFVLGFGNLVLALAIPGAFDNRGLLYGVSYLVIRVLLAGFALNNFREWRGFFVGPYGVGAVVSGPLLLVGGIVDGSARIVLWGIASAIDIFSPLLLRRQLARFRVRPVHYTHRYGLLLILVLGESVVQIGAVASHLPLTWHRMVAVAGSYALACGLWWAYFIHGLWTFRRAVVQSEGHGDVRRAILLYAHLGFSCGIIIISVGLAEVVRSPDNGMRAGDAALLYGGSALFLGTFAYTHWRLHRTVAWRRLLAGGACLVFFPVATMIPAVAALVILSGVIIVVNMVEQAILRRHGAGRFSGIGPYRPDGVGPETDSHADAGMRIGPGRGIDTTDEGPVVSDD